MSAAARLLACWPEIQAALRRWPEPWAADLLEFVEPKLEASADRGEAAAELSRERSARIRGRIRAVVGAMPLTQPMRELVKAVRQRLVAKGWKASDWTIEDELREIRREVSALKPARDCATVADVDPTRRQGERDGEG